MRLRLDRLKNNRMFMENLRWDVTPETIFKPRFVRDKSQSDLVKETQGFIFYIDYLGEGTPHLMVMKTYNLTSKTVGENLEDVPVELLMGAVQKEGVKDISGMYPIDEHLEGWLKERLGIAG
jgi:hypothetical protein